MSNVSGGSLDAVRRRAEARLASRRNPNRQLTPTPTRSQGSSLGGQQQGGAAAAQEAQQQQQQGGAVRALFVERQAQPRSAGASTAAVTQSQQSQPNSPAGVSIRAQPQPRAQAQTQTQAQQHQAEEPNKPQHQPDAKMLQPHGGDIGQAAAVSAAHHAAVHPPEIVRTREAESAMSMADAAIASSRKALEARSVELAAATAAAAATATEMASATAAAAMPPPLEQAQGRQQQGQRRRPQQYQHHRPPSPQPPPRQQRGGGAVPRSPGGGNGGYSSGSGSSRPPTPPLRHPSTPPRNVSGGESSSRGTPPRGGTPPRHQHQQQGGYPPSPRGGTSSGGGGGSWSVVGRSISHSFGDDNAAPSTIDSSEVFSPTTPSHTPVGPGAEGMGIGGARMTGGGVGGAGGVGTGGGGAGVGLGGASPRRRYSLELRRNDNAFHVVANVVADRLTPKIGAAPPPVPGAARNEFYDVDGSDRAFLDRMLPVEVRRNFVDALRERARNVTEDACLGEPKGDALVRRCCWLGLDRPDAENPLLNPDIRTVQVGFAAPVSLAAGAPLDPRPSFGEFAAASQRRRSLSPSAVRQYDAETLSLERRRREVAESERRLRVQADELEKRRMEAERYLEKRQLELRGIDVRAAESRRGAGGRRNEHMGNTPMSSLSCETGGSSLGVAGAGAGGGVVGGPSVVGDVGGGGPAPTEGGSDTTATRVSTADSLARQQVLAELREASALMANSVTPEAANFWKAHVMELQAQLRALDGGTVSTSPPTLPDGASASAMATDRIPTATAASFRARGDSGVSPSRDGNYLPPEEAAAAIEDARRQEKSVNSSQYESGKVQKIYVAPTLGSAGGRSSVDAAEKSAASESRALRAVGNSNKGKGTNAKEPISAEGFPMVDVVAPADLPEGYTFEAQMGTKRFLATVPPGGVARGEKFTCPMRDLDRVEIEVPAGKWRDGIGDCFAYGLFHPLILNTIFLPHIALGQIMARNSLTWLGVPGSKFQSKSACITMFMIILFWIAMNCVAFFVVEVHVHRGLLPSGVDVFCLVAVNLVMFVYTVYAVMNVRASIRKRYGIKKQYLSGQEDLVMATFCMPCTIAQMGRHTADFETYRAVCCSNTGLPRSVELAPARATGPGMAVADDGAAHVV